MDDKEREIRKQFKRIPDSNPKMWQYKNIQWTTEQAEFVIGLLLQQAQRKTETIYVRDDSCSWCGGYGNAGGCPKCGTWAMGN